MPNDWFTAVVAKEKNGVLKGIGSCALVENVVLLVHEAKTSSYG